MIEKANRIMSAIFKSEFTKEIENVIEKGTFILNNKPKGILKLENNKPTTFTAALINIELYKSFGVCDSLALEADILIRCHYATHIFDKSKGEQIIEVTISETSRLLYRKADGQNVDLPLRYSVRKAIENRIKSLVVIK